MYSDPIADMLTRVRNACRAALPDVSIPHSRTKESIARILKGSGYIRDFQVEGDKIKSLNLTLRYTGRTPAICGLKRVSRPGLRRYVGVSDIPRVLGGMGVAILSTPQGVLTDLEARKRNVGGELLCFVW